MELVETLRDITGKIIYKIFGNPSEKILRSLYPRLDEIAAWEPEIETWTDKRLKAEIYRFRMEIKEIRENDSRADDKHGAVDSYLDHLLPEAFAICREAAKRTLGMRHYDVQMIGGMVLHRGMIAEMVTGEGKTLVATLACYLNAVARKGKYVSYKKLVSDLDALNTENPLEFSRRVHDEGLWPDRLLPSAVPDPDNPAEPLVFVGGEPSTVHVVTVNDYLAKRDGDWNRPLFNLLGVTLGTIQAGMRSKERHHEYKCDITYGTNSEFGFDYLRDNMKMSPVDQVQKRRHFSIIDEVDSILIDEARTPLIISGGPDSKVTEKYFDAAELADHLKPVPEHEIEKKIKLSLQNIHDYEPEEGHYIVDEKDHSVTLTANGIREVERVLVSKGIIREGENYYHPRHMDWPHFIDNALKAKELYKIEDEYVVDADRDGRLGVIIVDEFTGRKMYGRRWSDGLHQAVEAKEIRRGQPIELEGETQTLATITLQNFFLLYDKISGMTGTAATEAAEFGKVYKLEVVVIPTNRPMRRRNFPDMIYGSVREKFEALVEEIKWFHEMGRPVLVGTTSVEKSEKLAGMLERAGLRGAFNVLNAKHHEREASIVTKAGDLGAITVATNMAGRGTDIRLGAFSQDKLLDYWKKTGFAPKNAEMSWGHEALEKALVKHWATLVLTNKKGEPLDKKKIKEMDFELLYSEVNGNLERMGTLMPHLCTSVADLGGLHIVGTERHEARRIDNQLRGRAGRQGDPGSNRFFLSLDDDLMRLFARDWVKSFLRRSGLTGGQALESRMVSSAIEKAQRRVEEQNFAIRRRLLDFDAVMNSQRQWIYSLRQRILEARDLRAITQDWLEQVCAHAVERYYSEGFPNIGEITMVVESLVDRFAPASDLTDDLALPGVETDENSSDSSAESKLSDGTAAPPIRYEPIVAGVNRRFEMNLSSEDYIGMDRALLRDHIIEAVVAYYDGKDEDLYHATKLAEWAANRFEIEIASEALKNDNPQQAYDRLIDSVMKHYEEREEELGEYVRTDPVTGLEIERAQRMRKLERYLMLEIIDKKWKDHLQLMDQLKSGIYLRSYAQKDPKEEYKREGGVLFEEMLDGVWDEFTDLLFKMVPTEEVEQQAVASVWQEDKQEAKHEEAQSVFEGREAQKRAAETGGGSQVEAVQTIRKGKLPEIRPNDRCPCGSGKKYKKCHGRPGALPLTEEQIRLWRRQSPAASGR